MKYFLIVLIKFYQKYLSPRKGYLCAYGVYYGHGTCSSIGLKIIQEKGIFGLFELRRQFKNCHMAYQNLQKIAQEKREINPSSPEPSPQKKSDCYGSGDSICDCANCVELPESCVDCGGCSPDCGGC